jgi:hypothetical protein
VLPDESFDGKKVIKLGGTTVELLFLDVAEKEFKMPKYATLSGYEAGLGMVARRYCGLWGRGT